MPCHTGVMTTPVSNRQPTISLRISPNERDQIGNLARKNDRTPSGEIRRAIRFYLANIEGRTRATRASGAGLVIPDQAQWAAQTVALSGREHAELQTAAHAIRDHHRQVEESLRAGFSSALAHAIEAGRKLIYAKSHLGHGGWGPWVEQNLAGIDSRTERLYRQLAEAAGDGRLPTGNAVTTLSIRKARELLIRAAPAGGGVSEGGEDGERRSRAPSLRRIARQALAPLRTGLVEDSGVVYEQLVEALAEELESTGYAREWARVLEELFAWVGAELAERGG